jgi:acyl-CoA thioesterase-1
MKLHYSWLGLWLLVYSVFAQGANLLVLGDSLSAGYGIDPQQGWVALLEQRLSDNNYTYKIINASVSGSTTNQGLQVLPTLLKQYQPKVVIVELGGNDGLRGLPLLTIRKNLSTIVQLSKKYKAKVLLVGVRLPPNYGPAYTGKFQQLFPDLAQQEKVAVIPLFLAGVDENSHLMQGDGIHPIAAAQAILLDNVWPQLKSLL